MTRRAAISVFWFLVFVPMVAHGQSVRRPPQDDSIWCQMWPDTCVNGEFTRMQPIPPLDVPRRVGLVALTKDGGYNGLWKNPGGFSNADAVDELIGYGVSAVQLWPMVDAAKSDDMSAVFDMGVIDLVVIRPMQHSFAEMDCNGAASAAWEGDGWTFGDIANDLYELYGDRDITVILTNWEADWQLWGPSCREPNQCPLGAIWPGENRNLYELCNGNYECQVEVCDLVRAGRAEYLRKLFNERQASVMSARMAHPDAVLRVYHMVTVNHTEDTYQLNVTRDVVPYLDLKPDLMGLSHWDKDQGIIEALTYIRTIGGFSRRNILVAEVGGENFKDQASAALDWGVAAVFGWVYKDWWSDVDKHGFVDYETNVPTSKMDDLLELIQEYE